jgi:hypothetical protein
MYDISCWSVNISAQYRVREFFSWSGFRNLNSVPLVPLFTPNHILLLLFLSGTRISHRISHPNSLIYILVFVLVESTSPFGLSRRWTQDNSSSTPSPLVRVAPATGGAYCLMNIPRCSRAPKCHGTARDCGSRELCLYTMKSTTPFGMSNLHYCVGRIHDYLVARIGE